MDIANNWKYQSINETINKLVFMIAAVNKSWKLPAGFFGEKNEIDSKTNLHKS